VAAPRERVFGAAADLPVEVLGLWDAVLAEGREVFRDFVLVLVFVFATA
jgi:hypothetical protein